MQAALSREHGDSKRELDELDLAVLSARRKDDRARIHLLIASRFLDERTLNRAEARRHFEQAHRLFPNMMEPLRGLEQLASADKVALAEVLRRQADADVDEAERIGILLRLAKLEEEDFRRPELAARTFERVLARSPKQPSVLDGLERCYRAARMWPELLDVLERAVLVDADDETRAARLKRLGDVLESKLGDLRSAVAAYQRLAEMLPEDDTVLGELARLAEKAGDVMLAVSCRERLADLSWDPVARARHHLLAGQLLAPSDPARSRRHFERAVAVDATSSSAWSALLGDARAENDAARTARYLEERANATEAPRARAICFVELAEVRAKAGDTAGARRAWEQAIAADPTNESAASSLLPIYVAERRYAQAEPLCSVVIAAAERDKDAYRLYTTRRTLVEVAFALRKSDVALTTALAAFASRPEEDDARRDLVRAACDMRADPDVLRAKDALVAIAERPDGLSVESRVMLGDVLALVGEGERASALYDEVLVETPNNERALAGLSQYHAASGNKVAALSLKRQRALALFEPKERFAALAEIGDAFLEIEETALAAEVYETARQAVPNDLPLLHKLLGVYQRSEQWVRLFDVLRSISEVDADPLRRAKTLFTMGQIASYELLDRGTALKLFDRTLDVDPSQLDAFERIVSILTEVKDWAGLEQMYKKMITRADANGDTRLSALLNKQLCLVYRDRIGDATLAIESIRRTIQLDEDDEEAQAMLRELLASVGQASGAVAITLERVLKDPLDARPYPALFELLASQNSRDRAFCVASAMHFLDITHPPSAAWRQSHGPPAVEAIPLDLGAEGWRKLLHPELDPTLTEIFQLVAPAVVELALSRLSIRERIAHPGPALKGQDWLGKMVARGAAVLGAPAPKLFVRKTPGAPLALAPTKPPSLLVYMQAFAGVSRGALAFMIGKRILELTPPLLARALCPSITELKALASSAARIATHQVEAGDLQLRERLKREEVARIASVVETSMAQGGKLDVLRWSQLADVSASYGGLLLAGDLEAARAAIAIEPQAPGDLNPREKMRELVAWFLGDRCAELRSRLGIGLV
jgi:tetratricopeptide (TPR) repeat protein